MTDHESDELELIPGNGNVWRDFGYADADLRQAKDVLAARIIEILDDQNMSPRTASQASGFAAADFARIHNATYGRFTLDHLIRILHALDDTVTVSVRVTEPKQDAQTTP